MIASGEGIEASVRAVQRQALSPDQGMEPTGIGPVTSCLQNGTARVPEGPDSLGIAGESALYRLLTDTAGLGAIGPDLGSGIGLLPKGH